MPKIRGSFCIFDVPLCLLDHALRQALDGFRPPGLYRNPSKTAAKKPLRINGAFCTVKDRRGAAPLLRQSVIDIRQFIALILSSKGTGWVASSARPFCLRFAVLSRLKSLQK